MMLLKILPSLSNPYSPRSFGFTAVKLLPNVGMFYSDGKFTCDENLYTVNTFQLWACLHTSNFLRVFSMTGQLD